MLKTTECLSIVIVNYNSGDILSRCIDSIPCSFATETVVVDNASSDDSIDAILGKYPNLRLLRSERNLGFAGGVNSGFAATAGEIVLVLNPDVLLREDCVSKLVGVLQSDKTIGVAGCKLLYPDGITIQHAGGIVEYPLALANHIGYREVDSGQYNVTRDVDYVTGACFAVRRSLWEILGGFDEAFFPAYYEETDFCFRARNAGYRVVVVPFAAANHMESATIVRNSPSYYKFFHRNRLRFVLKHYTTRQIISEFYPAEFKRLGSIESVDELAALQEAYDTCKAHLRDTLASSREPEDKFRHEKDLTMVLDNLSKKAGESGDLSIDHGRLDNSSVSGLNVKWEIRERPFTSGAPLLGGLIVRMRQAWNWMSTKWYVVPIVQQQNEYNHLVAKAIEELQVQIHAIQYSELENDQHAVTLARDLARIELRLKRIEELLGNLSEKVS